MWEVWRGKKELQRKLRKGFGGKIWVVSNVEKTTNMHWNDPNDRLLRMVSMFIKSNQTMPNRA